MISLARAPGSFNILQATHNLSPSTLSRILQFLRRGGLVEVSIRHRWDDEDERVDKRAGPKKLYSLTKKGKRALPHFKRLDMDKMEILKMTRTRY